MKTILVTGGLGFIGSHTVVELMEQGFDVVIADNLSNSQPEVVDNIAQITGKKPAFEQINLTDTERTKQLFQTYKPDGVIHFAAFKAVGESVQNPLKYYKNNLLSLINILEGMRENHTDYLVFSSSCTVYGQPEKLPVTEQTPIKPALSPYGNTKQVAEEIINDFLKVHQKEHNFQAISLRYFNPIGAHPSGLIGELPLGVPDNLMPYITQTAIGKRPQLKVFGNDYHTPDGTCIRDYLHVCDLAKAHIAALNYMRTHQTLEQAEVFNLGTGKGFSVLDVIHSFERTSGVKLNYEFAPKRAGDIEQIWADPTKANLQLGWKAELSLDDMTATAWKWEQHHFAVTSDKQ